MTWTRELADALRDAANRIANRPATYYWCSVLTCNCGILAQSICGVTATQLHALMFREWPEHCGRGIWSDRSDACSNTDQPLPRVMIRLREAGLTWQDIAQLEALANDRIRSAAGLPANTPAHHHDFANPTSVIAYMWAWADMIDEQFAVAATRAAPIAAMQPVIQPVVGDALRPSIFVVPSSS